MRPNPITKDARLNLAAAAVLNLMRYGQSLQLEYCSTGPRWQLSGGARVKDAVARIVIANPQIITGDDALFSSAKPQTWRAK